MCALFFLRHPDYHCLCLPSRPSTDQQRPTLIKLTNFKTTSGSINIAEQIGKNYQTLGIQILEDATGSVTDTIEEECHHNAYKINVRILQRWVEGWGRKPITWATLIEVLRDIELSVLANDIEQNL